METHTDKKKPLVARFLEKSQLPFRVFLAAFLLDIFTKILASEFIASGSRVNLLGNFVRLAGDVRNNSGSVGLWSLVWTGGVIAILYFWKKEHARNPRMWVPLALIMAGNSGNIAEIILRPSGVVDWICIAPPFGVCTNIADLYIWAGYGSLAAGIVHYFAYGWKNKKDALS